MQVDSINSCFESSYSQRLKLGHEKSLSISAVKSNVRRYSLEETQEYCLVLTPPSTAAAAAAAAAGTDGTDGDGESASDDDELRVTLVWTDPPAGAYTRTHFSST